MDIPQRKTNLRYEAAKRIESMNEKKRQEESEDVCQRILEILPTSVFFEICGYMPLQDEIDITSVLRELLQRKCTIYLPRYVKNGLSFHAVSSLNEELHPGKFNIHEPHPHLPRLNPLSLRFALIPGRAFDSTGRRLGRGKGAYDTWIAAQRKANPQTTFLGIAFREQLFEEIPEDIHDQRVDQVIIPEN